MIIRRMTASFGQLENRTLELEEGLNVITSPNESGKSTWCAFIRAMLYGVDSSERSRAGYLPDKQRYAPWSGRPMEGTMEISHRGKDITLSRSTRVPNAPMREFAAVYSGTGEPVPELSGADAGQILCGVSRDVFFRSAFIAQGEVAVSGTAELERRIASVVSTGDENMSYSEADERLRSWQRKRRFNKRGAIPELEQEIQVSQQNLSKISDVSENIASARRELEANESISRQLDSRLKRLRLSERSTALEGVESARAQTRGLEEALAGAMAQEAKLESAVHIGPFSGMTPEQAAETAALAAQKAEDLGTEAARRGQYVGTLFLALAAIAFAFMGGLWLIAAAVAVIAGLALYVIALRIKSRAAEAAMQQSRIFDSFDAEGEAGLYAAADAHAHVYEQWHAASRARQRVSADLQAARSARDEVESALVSESQSSELARLHRETERVTEAKARLRSRIAQLEGLSAAMGDANEIEDDLRAKSERIAVLEEQYAALELALDVLKKADSQMQRRFSPELGRRAASYLSRLTDGRYDELSLDRDFAVMTHISGDVLQRPALYMSAGASDLMYIALRLAIIDLTLPSDEPCPVVLDDALVNLDPERRERVLELLEELAEKRQIILFTCY